MSSKSGRILGEQAGEKGLNRYSLMEARRALAVLRKACKEAPEKHPHVSRYAAVRWLCYCFATALEKNVDRAAHRIRELNRMLEGLPDATRAAALRVMDGRRHEAADEVARQAPLLAEYGAFYRLVATLPGDLRGFARKLMDGSRHADIAARYGVSKDEVAAYRAAIQRLLAASRPGTGNGERDDDSARLRNSVRAVESGGGCDRSVDLPPAGRVARGAAADQRARPHLRAGRVDSGRAGSHVETPRRRREALRPQVPRRA